MQSGNEGLGNETTTGRPTPINLDNRKYIMSHIDYTVLTTAIANAALSRRAALQMEMSVSLVHFTQEGGGTDSTGKANLKAVYHGAGYICLAKADRDYKTVNRRLNAMAKLFDKIGSSVVFSWMEKAGQDTQTILDCVQSELACFGFDTLDDVLYHVGTDTNRTRAPRQPVAAPVSVSVPAPVAAPVSVPVPAPVAAPVTVIAAAPVDLDAAFKAIVTGYGAEIIREFCTRLLVHVAQVEVAEEQASAPLAHAEELAVEMLVATAVKENDTVTPMFPATRMVTGKAARKAARRSA